MVIGSGGVGSLRVTILISTIPDIMTALGDVALRVGFPVTKLLPTASSLAEDSVLRDTMALSAVLVAF